MYEPSGRSTPESSFPSQRTRTRPRGVGRPRTIVRTTFPPRSIATVSRSPFRRLNRIDARPVLQPQTGEKIESTLVLVIGLF